MFSTAPLPWYVAPKPTISRPPLHNARYEGWVRPPIQLPRVDTPSRHPYEVATTNSQPHRYATHPRMISGAQAHDIMGHAQRRNIPSWQWIGGAYTPSLQGASEMRTRAQHDTENTCLIYDHSTRQTMPLNINDTKKAHPHPFPSSSPFAGCGYEFLRVPLTPERPRQIRLTSPDFPWAFDIGPSAGEEVVTCLDVLSTLHAELQRPLTDMEWGTAGDEKRASLIRARDRRLWIQLALQGSSGSAARTRPTVSFERPVQREPLLLRVDWLGSSVAFMGLVKDEAFARKRFVPGGGERPETWVVKFQKL
ncbi:hypothetical protein DFJ58DRAFT_744223 [Suillus subalutaceus]|uniref:uncharacterized protein n=1 Tax=Suillus subalutaceus TaxID=48586 RepID=UPI001B85D7D2|nr:uncharacterized protein DFJ58DRAFT_744223 [Suillus subalutaceus]KAG1861564.1 hypothetical protein DFJ58DRAFT_744223 [Suillus subalutaceus]